MARWPLLMCMVAAMLMTSLGVDVIDDTVLALDAEEETAPQGTAPIWPGQALRNPELVELTMVQSRLRSVEPVWSREPDWSRGPVHVLRARRSPQNELEDEEDEEEEEDEASPTPDRRRRRKKGRRRGGRRRGGKRRRKGRRTSTTAEPTTTAAPPQQPQWGATTLPPWLATTTAAAQRSWRRRYQSTTSATYTERTTTTAPPTTLPPLPDYNVAPAGSVNHRPVIGVLAQTVPQRLKSLTPDEDSNYISSFIAAAYVKLLESAGARVVPVMIGQSDHYYREMYRYLNGLLLPDGEADTEDSAYSHAFKTMWKVADQHEQDHFPVLGVGLGMELILNAEGQVDISTCDAENLAATVDVSRDSRLFSRSGGSDLSSQLASTESAAYFRRRCLTTGGLQASGRLADKFQTIGTSRDHSGRTIAAGVEHKRRPVWGVQFRPEMPLFEWSRDEAISNVPRSEAATRLSHHLANAFVAEARLSRHRFPSEDLEDDYLIYNYEPEYTGVRGSRYTACYFFA